MEEHQQSQNDNLRVTSLTLHNFRNYQRLVLEDISDLTILVGPNAIGKTSIIEAVQLVTSLKSFRATHVSQLVTWGNDNAFISAVFSNRQRYLEEKMEIKNNKRTYLLNGKSRHVKDLKGLVPAVIFTPDDLELVKGSNSVRRASLDDLGSQLSKNFYAVKNDYQKLLRQKTQALKEDATNDFLFSINEVLAKVGAQFFVHRRTLCEKVSPFLEQAYQSIVQSEEDLKMHYVSRWIEEHTIAKSDIEKQLLSQMNSVIDEERVRKKNLVGPHTDEILFLLNGQNSLHFASQGQQRSIVLAYKIAEANTIQDVLGQQPVLLLDDVMSELDESRRLSFMEFVQQDRQTFITTTNLSYFNDDLIARANVYQLPFEQDCA